MHGVIELVLQLDEEIISIIVVDVKILPHNFLGSASVDSFQECPHLVVNASVVFVEDQVSLQQLVVLVLLLDVEYLVVDWTWWQDAYLLVLTYFDHGAALARHVCHGTDLVGDEALPLEEPVAGYHEPQLVDGLLFLVVFEVLVQNELLLHLPSEINAVELEGRYIHRFVKDVLEHLKWSKDLTVLTEDDVLVHNIFAVLADPLLVSFQYVTELNSLPVLLQIVQHEFAIAVQQRVQLVVNRLSQLKRD